MKKFLMALLAIVFMSGCVTVKAGPQADFKNIRLVVGENVAYSIIVPFDMPNFFKEPYEMTGTQTLSPYMLMADFRFDGKRYSILLVTYGTFDYIASVYDAQIKTFWTYDRPGDIPIPKKYEEAVEFFEDLDAKIRDWKVS